MILYDFLWNKWKRKKFVIHRLVAQFFLKTIINHKDWNKTNNHVDNLEWCTQSNNIQHAFNKWLKKQQ